MNEDNITKLVTAFIESLPNLITAYIAYLTYKELEKGNKKDDNHQLGN
ncbi:hypothetical protein [Allofustis seminis]|nr:hypothetical protein [Allofustis seminis]